MIGRKKEEGLMRDRKSGHRSPIEVFKIRREVIMGMSREQEGCIEVIHQDQQEGGGISIREANQHGIETQTYSAR